MIGPIKLDDPLPWTPDNRWIDECKKSLDRGYVRRCGNCEQCGNRFEIEFTQMKNKVQQQKQVQCRCGYIQPIFWSN